MDASAAAFLTTFAIILGAAAVTTVLFQRLRQPVILGYLLAGLLVGPYVTLLPVVADERTTEMVAELGVIMLLFSVGLGFSLRHLMRVGGSSAITGIIELSLVFWLGNAAARLLGWNATEALFAGAAASISSTTIIGKIFEDRKIGGKLREKVVSVLIVEDLFSILMLAALVPIAAGQSTSGDTVVWTALRLFGILAVTLVLGIITVPRLMRWVSSLGSKEPVLITAVALAFGMAWMEYKAGYSVALGAFLAGSLVAESGEGDRVMELILPVRDIFGAVFFVSVGMLIDPFLVREYWLAVLVFTLVVVFGKVVGVSLGSFLTGTATRMSIRSGMSMAQIGEFSFIIAGVGAGSVLVGNQLYPVLVAVSVLTTMITPWLIRASPAVAAYVDSRLPRPIQTYMSLYGTWVDHLRAAPRERTMGQKVRRQVRWMLIDAVSVVGVVIGASLLYPWLVQLLNRWPITRNLSPAPVIVIVVLMVISPILVGMIRIARGLAQLLARAALPHYGRLDRASAPRLALIITFEFLILLLFGIPILAATNPFLPIFHAGVLFFLGVAFLSVMMWRSARNLEGHVLAGTEALLAAIASSLPPVRDQVEGEQEALAQRSAGKLAAAVQMLPGIGTPERVQMVEGQYAIGRSLSELGVRGRTGATILGITRSGVAIPAPSKEEHLEVNDILLLVGTTESINAAKLLLARGPGEE